MGLALPIENVGEVERALSALAIRQSGHHDGFHLVEASSGRLTHVSQFVSPPLAIALANPDATWPRGARQMTALLISTIPQVNMAGVITMDGEVLIYMNGRVIERERTG